MKNTRANGTCVCIKRYSKAYSGSHNSHWPLQEYTHSQGGLYVTSTAISSIIIFFFERKHYFKHKSGLAITSVSPASKKSFRSSDTITGEQTS